MYPNYIIGPDDRSQLFGKHPVYLFVRFKVSAIEHGIRGEVMKRGPKRGI